MEKENLKLISSFLILLGLAFLCVGVFAPSLPLELLYAHTLDVATNVNYQDPPWTLATEIGGKCIWGIPNIEMSTSNFNVPNVNGKIAFTGIKFNGDQYYLAYEINRRLIDNGYGSPQWIKVDGLTVNPYQYTPTATVTQTTQTTSAVSTTLTQTTATSVTVIIVTTVTEVKTSSIVTQPTTIVRQDTTQTTFTVFPITLTTQETVVFTVVFTPITGAEPVSIGEWFTEVALPFMVQNLNMIGVALLGTGLLLRAKLVG